MPKDMIQEREKALENQFFDKKNRHLLEQMRATKEREADRVAHIHGGQPPDHVRAKGSLLDVVLAHSSRTPARFQVCASAPDDGPKRERTS